MWCRCREAGVVVCCALLAVRSSTVTLFPVFALRALNAVGCEVAKAAGRGTDQLMEDAGMDRGLKNAWAP